MKIKIVFSLLKIEINKKLRNVYHLLIENPNVKTVNEKPIALRWIESNLLSALSDPSISDNNKNNFNSKGNDNKGRSYESDRSDDSTAKDNDSLQRGMIKEDVLNINEIEQILKSDSRMEYKKPFYYCKECPKVQFKNYEEVKNHFLYAKVHQTK